MQPQSYKICPVCQQPAALTEPTCQRCGHQYRTQFLTPDQTKVVVPPPQHQQSQNPIPFADWGKSQQAKANMEMIISMWVLVGFESMLLTWGAFGFALLIDVISALIGLSLVFSRNSTDKINGWARLTLEIFGFIWAVLGHRGY